MRAARFIALCALLLATGAACMWAWLRIFTSGLEALP